MELLKGDPQKKRAGYVDDDDDEENDEAAPDDLADDGEDSDDDVDAVAPMHRSHPFAGTHSQNSFDPDEEVDADAETKVAQEQALSNKTIPPETANVELLKYLGKLAEKSKSASEWVISVCVCVQ